MARTRRLDADLLAAAYERDARRLLVFFTRRTYDAQLAVDLVGETYARAFEVRRRFAGDARDADALAKWVFGIARNVLNETLRRGAAERRALRRAGVQAPSLAGEELARIEELAALGELRWRSPGRSRSSPPSSATRSACASSRSSTTPTSPAGWGSASRPRGRASRVGCGRSPARWTGSRRPRRRRERHARDRRDPRRARSRPARRLGAPAAPVVARALAALRCRRAAMLVLVPTAVAARDAIFAPAPATLPDAARPPASVAPERAGAQVYVAAGERARRRLAPERVGLRITRTCAPSACS